MCKVVGKHASDTVCSENGSAKGMYGNSKVDLKLRRAKSPACLGFHVCIALYSSTAAELFPSFHLCQALTRMAADKNMGGNYSYISLFRTPVLRRISLCSGVVW